MQDIFYRYMLSNYDFDEFEYGTAEEKPLLADFVTYSTVIWVADDYTTVFASQHIDDFKTYYAVFRMETYKQSSFLQQLSL
jgi:hypothetical protein